LFISGEGETMSKKIILLALAAASVAAFALPGAAMAAEEDKPLHAVGVELNKPQPIDGEGSASLTGAFGSITCKSSSGSATFTSTTTGKFEQTFNNCVDPFGGECHSENQPGGLITTLSLEFHLVTVEHTPTTGTPGPGVLVTPSGGTFATFDCRFFGHFTVGGTGLIGTITKPKCGEVSTESTLQFSSAEPGVQTHKTVAGTTTEYSITSNEQASSEDASGIITFKNAEGKAKEVKLECT
jgi:hypothetical protein